MRRLGVVLVLLALAVPTSGGAGAAVSGSTEVAPAAGTLTKVDVGATAQPWDVEADGSGGVWFSTAYAAPGLGTVVGHLAADRTLTTLTLPDGYRATHAGLERGADGNVWVAATKDGGTGSIVRIAPDLAMTRFPALTADDLTVAPDGVWFVNGSTSVKRLDADGSVTSFPVGVPAEHVVYGPDGLVWFDQDAGSGTSHTIWSITSSGVTTPHTHDWITNPGTLHAGPDGEVWFLAGGALRNLSGTKAWFDVNHSPHYGRNLVVGPDGAVWINDTGTGGMPTLIRLHPNATPPMGGTSTTFELPCTLTSFARVGDQFWLACGTSSAVGVFDLVGVPSTPVQEAWSPNVESHGIIIHFESSALDGGSPVQKYTVTLAPGGATCVPPWPEDASHHCTFVNLENGRSYTATVVATNANGDSPPLVIGPMALTGTPNSPQAIAAVAGDRSAAVSWQPPALDSGYALAGYEVTASPGGSTCTVAAPSTACTVPELVNGTAYTFTVRGTNEKGSGLTSAASNAVVPHRFDDVPGGAPFFGDIEWLAASGIAAGYPDGGFHPAAPVSRGAMAAFLYRFLGSPAGPTPACAGNVFTDVPAGSAFCGEIEWLAAQGVVAGDAVGTFRPGAAVSRQATAAFLHRIAVLDTNAADVAVEACPPPFSDVPSTSVFCQDIAWAKANEIVTGDPGGTYRPTAPVSRQAMAAFLHRLDPIVHPG